MNFNFSQIGAQLSAVWKQLGLNQRISLVLAAGVVLIGLAGLMVWSSRTDYALLYGKLDDAEAAKVIAALDDAKIPYKVSRGGGTISVPVDKVHVMRMQLAGKGIPRGEGVGFEIFDKPNFGESDFVQRANYLRAVQGELARTIGQVDAIEQARVMIVMPENRLLVDNQRKPTASVFVKVRGNANLPSQTVNAIRFLVANAVEGLQSNFVSVVDNQGNVLSENNENDTLAGLSSGQLLAKKQFDMYLSKNVEGMLERVLGPGQAVVRVSAEINFDSLKREEEKYDPEGQVLRTSNTTDENTDSSTPNAGGVPGTAANSSTETNSVAATASNKNNTKKKTLTSQYEINKTVSTTVQNAGGLRRLSAAVFVATRMIGSGTNRVATPRSPEELLKLRRLVQSALGIQENAENVRKDEITVEEMAFNDQPAIEMTQQLDQQQTRRYWTDLAVNAVYPVIGLIVLGFFWRAFKKTPALNIPLGVPLGEFGFGPNGTGLPGSKGQNAAGGTPPVVTVDVLNKLIRENPDNMTQAIRTWMTRSTPPSK